jgi:DNA-binding transcriptional ArsR family regulator
MFPQMSRKSEKAFKHNTNESSERFLEANIGMRMSQAKKKILKILSEAGEPVKLQDIAEKSGLSVSSAMMHLLWLRRTGYVSTPKKSHYAITESGDEVVSLPKADKKQASYLMRELPVEKAFHFYTGINQYMGVYAKSLTNFCEKIVEINPKSIEFHVLRRDFESWLRGLGDQTLAEKIGSIRRMELSGEELRKKLYETVKSRCDELASLSSRR